MHRQTQGYIIAIETSITCSWGGCTLGASLRFLEEGSMALSQGKADAIPITISKLKATIKEKSRSTR
jgi:hypothetical protein